MSFTHHAAGRLQLSVRNTLEVLLAAAVVFGAVAHGSKGRQEVLHRLKVSGHHGFFSGGDKEKCTLKWFRRHLQSLSLFMHSLIYYFFSSTLFFLGGFW